MKQQRVRHPTVRSLGADFVTVGAERVESVQTIGSTAANEPRLIGVTLSVDRVLQIHCMLATVVAEVVVVDFRKEASRNEIQPVFKTELRLVSHLAEGKRQRESALSTAKDGLSSSSHRGLMNPLFDFGELRTRCLAVGVEHRRRRLLDEERL
jgi:hypothetical protein